MGALQYRTCAGNPNTLNEVGALTEKIYDTVNGIEYQCKTAGTGAWYSKDGFLQGEIKEFIATCSQASTNAPTFDVIFKNTITPGVTPVFAYISAGRYTLTFSGTSLSVYCIPMESNINLSVKKELKIQVLNNTTINIHTNAWTSDITTLTPTDEILGASVALSMINLVVYPAS